MTKCGKLASECSAYSTRTVGVVSFMNDLQRWCCLLKTRAVGLFQYHAQKNKMCFFFFAVLSIGVFMFISACSLDFINLSPYFTTCERNSQKYDCNRVSSKNL